MRLRVGILSTAHMHVWGYVAGLKQHEQAELVGVWDDHADRLAKFGAAANLPTYAVIDDLLDRVDAVVITSENTKHAGLAAQAAAKGKHILCEKPLVASKEHIAIMRD